MGIVQEITKNDIFLLSLFVANIILLVAYIINIVKYNKLNKRYNNFMKKFESGNNFEEMLKGYINKVENIQEVNKEIINYCENIDKNITQCIQKVGIVRYSAFKDTGSDLSFALALLDSNNDGVVLNGIYSREMSNIYAKPVINGKSTYTIIEEEQQAINKAIDG